MASCAAASSFSGTRTVNGSSSPSVPISASMPAFRSISWISSASATSPATTTCTIPAILCRRYRARARFDEVRLTPLGVRHLDHVEVARHDGRLEDRPGLVRELRPEVPRRDVREGEKPCTRKARHLGRLGGCRVQGLACALLLLVA